MKILMVGDFRVIHCRRYVDLLQKSGCDVFVLDLARARRPGSVPVSHYFRWPLRGTGFFTLLLGKRAALRIAEQVVTPHLKKLIATLGPDIVHVQGIGSWPWPIVKVRPARLVLTAWGTDINQTRAPDFDAEERRAIAECLRMAALVIGDSQEVLEQAMALSTKPLSTLCVPIGIDTNAFRPGYLDEAAQRRRQLGIPQEATVILSPRALRENYGHHLVVEAFAEARAAGSGDLFLLIKAYDCWDVAYKSRLWDLAVRLGVSHRVRIVDEVAYAQLPGLYATASIAVNFAAMDAFPVTFLECLACALPIVTNSLPAYFNHGISHHLCFTEDRSAPALAARLGEVLSRLPEQRRAAIEARAYVCSTFDESLIGRVIVDAYRKILEQDRCPA